MQLIFLDSFYKDIKKVKEKSIKSRLKTAIIKLEETEGFLNSKLLVKIKGHPIAFRIRIGSYRLGCYLKSKDTLILARFIKRNDIYKVFP